ncbi:MAG: hypothetical protein HPY50_14495 [Firmicutes bacterium]|nr:hypothetical protein [Bacillota bacterium]
MSTWPLKPMGVGGILDQIFQCYRRIFGRLLLLSLIFIGAIFLVAAVGIFGVFLTSGNMRGFGGLGILGMLLIYIVLLGMVIVCYASNITLVRQSVLGQNTGLIQAIKESCRRFWPLFGYSLLFGLGLLVVLLIVVGIFSVLMAGFLSGGPGTYVIMTVIGVLLGVPLFIGVMYLVIRISFFFPIVMEGGGQPFGNSWRMTRGSFWRLLAVFIVINVVYIIILYGGQLLALLPGWLSIVGMILSLFINIAISPIPIVAFTICYYDLKARTEGPDLQDMISATLSPPEEAAGQTPVINMEG